MIRKITFSLILGALSFNIGNAQSNSQIDFEQSFKMGHGTQSVTVEQFRREGTQTVIITPTGFGNNEIKRLQLDSPIVNVKITDLNNDNKPEYFLTPLPAGSGGYVYLIGYEEGSEGNLKEIEFTKKPTLNLPKGYRGKDEYKFLADRIIHSFPVYNINDANCCPTKGKRVVEYFLEKDGGKSKLVPKIYYGN